MFLGRVQEEWYRFSQQGLTKDETMKVKTWRERVAGLFFLALLAACSQSGTLQPTAKPEDLSFNQFADIPIPTGAKMDLDRTLLLGSGEGWIGRLVTKNSNNINEIFSFYKSELPKFGWQEVSSVRSALSVLTYQRGSRVATVQIQGTTFGGSSVDFTVSPQGGGGADFAPAPTSIPTQRGGGLPAPVTRN
jgi:hypothetical protein